MPRKPKPEAPVYFLGRSSAGLFVFQLDPSGFEATAVQGDAFVSVLRLGVAAVNTGLSEKQVLRRLAEMTDAPV